MGDFLCDECQDKVKDDKLLLCDECGKAYHKNCARPIVARIPNGSWLCPKCKNKQVEPLSNEEIYKFFKIEESGEEDRAQPFCGVRRPKKRSRLSMRKKERRLLPYVPIGNHKQKFNQLGSLAFALKSVGVEFSDELIYTPNMAPRSANQAIYEKSKMQVLPKVDLKTMELCKAMTRRGEHPPLRVVFDSCQGFTVEADGPIEDMTFIAEYVGDVDYSENREYDDCDTQMKLLSAENPSQSLVICADKRGNISRFVSGINNNKSEDKKKINCKFVTYNIRGESRILLVAIRDIKKGERLYCDYNGLDREYPTDHFV